MDALKATLPAGTVSGPRNSCDDSNLSVGNSQAFDLRRSSRLLGHNDQADFAIAIRTMVVKDKKPMCRLERALFTIQTQQVNI